MGRHVREQIVSFGKFRCLQGRSDPIGCCTAVGWLAGSFRSRVEGRIGGLDGSSRRRNRTAIPRRRGDSPIGVGGRHAA